MFTESRLPLHIQIKLVELCFAYLPAIIHLRLLEGIFLLRETACSKLCWLFFGLLSST